MRASRVLFPGPRGMVADKYSHMKMYAVSGHVGSDRSSWYVWTGSNNWTDRGLHADEATLRIRSQQHLQALRPALEVHQAPPLLAGVGAVRRADGRRPAPDPCAEPRPGPLQVSRR